MNEWADGYTADRLRSARLLRANWEQWSRAPGSKKRPPQRFGWAPEAWIRGFPSKVTFSSSLTPAQAREWFLPHPIATADFSHFDQIGRRSTLRRLSSDALPHLRTIQMHCTFGSDPPACAAACRALAAAECRSGLKRLGIDGEPTLEGLEALITSRHLGGLESLSVDGYGIGDEYAQLLAEKMTLPALKELALSHRGLTPKGAHLLGRVDWFTRLHALRLCGYEQLGDPGLRNLFVHPFPELRTLRIHHCGQTGAVLQLLAGARLPALTELILAGRHLHDTDWVALTGGSQELRSLSVGSLYLTSDTPAGIFNRPATHNLRRLVCADMPIWEHRLAELTRSPLTQTLRWLELFPSDLDAGQMLLAGREWPHLERLVLRGGVPGESLLALIASDKFPRLVSLTTFCSNDWAKFLKQLARSPAAAKFRELDLGAHMTSLAARELADSPHLADIDRLMVRKGSATQDDCKRLTRRFGARIEIDGYFPD
jgi:hypothetical protein